jgi:hypothetical protein
LIKKSQQKKSRLHFSFLSATAMQAIATMGATFYIYLGHRSLVGNRYNDKELQFHRRSPIAFLSAQWDDLFSRLHNQAENEKTNKAISTHRPNSAHVHVRF